MRGVRNTLNLLLGCRTPNFPARVGLGGRPLPARPGVLRPRRPEVRLCWFFSQCFPLNTDVGYFRYLVALDSRPMGHYCRNDLFLPRWCRWPDVAVPSSWRIPIGKGSCLTSDGCRPPPPGHASGARLKFVVTFGGGGGVGVLPSFLLAP